jgi:Outer membrane protein beta-barrel domain
VKCFKAIAAVVMVVSIPAVAGIDCMIGGGLNVSSQSFTHDYTTMVSGSGQSMLVGFNAGANARLAFTRKTGLVAGLNYETRGSILKWAGQTQTYSASYLQIPVLFSYNVMPALAVNSGPEAGIFLRGKYREKFNYSSSSLDITDKSALDLGASLQATYTIANMVVVGAGYYWGFLNTDNYNYGSGLKPNGSVTNRNINVTVAYLLHL